MKHNPDRVSASVESNLRRAYQLVANGRDEQALQVLLGHLLRAVGAEQEKARDEQEQPDQSGSRSCH